MGARASAMFRSPETPMKGRIPFAARSYRLDAEAAIAKPHGCGDCGGN